MYHPDSLLTPQRLERWDMPAGLHSEKSCIVKEENQHSQGHTSSMRHRGWDLKVLSPYLKVEQLWREGSSSRALTRSWSIETFVMNAFQFSCSLCLILLPSQVLSLEQYPIGSHMQVCLSTSGPGNLTHSSTWNMSESHELVNERTKELSTWDINTALFALKPKRMPDF